ncbi:MAG: NAD(+) kinase, partial [Prochlorococcus sp.]|nr:NAD(+) kinase [Prochlorococcus sp.]
MRLDLVWVIYRTKSKPAESEAQRCAEELRALGAQVFVAMSGQMANPFPELLASSTGLP